jgi:hypothetical protein
MTIASVQADESPSLWSEWGEATDIQRAHFKTLAGHRAWSRVCGGCGEGDFLERKQKPTNVERGLRGRGFPVLPEPTEEGVKRRRFRTPPGRVHTCVPVASVAATTRADGARRRATR